MSESVNPSAIRWLPDPVPPRTKRREETQDELWEEDNVSRVSALIRESIQNSLDEVFDSSAPVQVSFSLNTQTQEVHTKYFNDLIPHVQASLGGGQEDYLRNANYLLIEDFNTLGMEGSTREVKPSLRDPDDKKLGSTGDQPKESFWNFTWVSGSTSKKVGSNRGSRGVGKIVFPINSGIRSYLVFSSRRQSASPDGDPQILFGHSLLTYHDLNGVEYKPDIYWMVEADARSRVTIPSCDETEISTFVADWKLQRQSHELGSSILIPYCDASLSGNRIIQTIIRDYFVEILSKRLVCKVHSFSESPIVIDHETLIGLIGDLDEDLQNDVTKSSAELKLICQMYLDYLSADSEKIESLIVPLQSDSKNDWNSIHFDFEIQEKLLIALNAGKILVFDIEASVPKSKREGIPETESVHTFEVMIKQEFDVASSTIFTREGILIPAANKRSVLQDAISLLAVGTAKSGRLAIFLRSSEGAAHDKWRHDAKNIKGIYSPDKDVKKLLDFIKTAPEKLWKLLQRQDDAVEDEGLSKYFPSSSEADFSRGGSNGGDTESGATEDIKKVVLTGKRLGADGHSAKLKWSTLNVQQTSFEIFDTERNGPAIASGQSAKELVLTGLLQNQSYKLFVRVQEEASTYDSNFLGLPPLEEPSITNFVVKVASGFQLSSQYFALPIGAKLNIQVAYRSRGSKSLEKWSQEDFKLQDLLNSHHGLIIVHSGNRIHIEVENLDFAATWQGFDPLRDLLIESELERS